MLTCKAVRGRVVSSNCTWTAAVVITIVVLVATLVSTLIIAYNDDGQDWDTQTACHGGRSLNCNFASDYISLINTVKGLGVNDSNIYLLIPPPDISPCDGGTQGDLPGGHQKQLDAQREPVEGLPEQAVRRLHSA